jgi:hypothetical protein
MFANYLLQQHQESVLGTSFQAIDTDQLLHGQFHTVSVSLVMMTRYEVRVSVSSEEFGN